MSNPKKPVLKIDLETPNLLINLKLPHPLINLKLQPPENEYEERVAERRNRKMLQAFMIADLHEKFHELDVLPKTPVTTAVRTSSSKSDFTSWRGNGG